jgi:hypothetical protein
MGETATSRPFLDQHALHYNQRRIALEYADAGLQSKRGGDIDGQIDVHGSEAVNSFFHALKYGRTGCCSPDLAKIKHAAWPRGYTVWMNSNPRMRFKPPLTRADLVAIQERNPGSPDVRTLLWEMKRFPALALYIDQLQRILGTLSGPQGDILQAIRAQLKVEPCVRKFPRLPPAA